MDEKVLNASTRKMRTEQRIAVGEILDMRELGVMKKASTKKMKAPQLERRYVSTHETGECLIRWFSMKSSGRSEIYQDISRLRFRLHLDYKDYI
jgi:hypothetical protein